jgi:polyisoprenoid-binding protein YceI
MKKLIISVFALGALLSSCAESGKKAETTDAKEVEVVQTETTTEFKTIKDGSHLTWKAAHLGGVNERFGKVSLSEGQVLVNNGKVSNANFVIDLGSLTVESIEEKEQSDKLAGHLKSGDFFNIEKFPTAKFELTSIDEVEGDFNAKVTGNLTISGVSKSITFNTNITESESEISIKSEDFVVDRKDWGLTYHAEGSEGVPTDYLIADDIGFTIDVTLTK